MNRQLGVKLLMLYNMFDGDLTFIFIHPLCILFFSSFAPVTLLNINTPLPYEAVQRCIMLV